MKDLNLVLTGVRASDSGRYFCRVTSEVGSVQSREAGLRVEDRQQAPEISHRWWDEWPMFRDLSRQIRAHYNNHSPNSQTADVPGCARSEDCAGLPGLWLPAPNLLLVQRWRETVLGPWQVIRLITLETFITKEQDNNSKYVRSLWPHNALWWHIYSSSYPVIRILLRTVVYVDLSMWIPGYLILSSWRGWWLTDWYLK